MTDTTKQIPHSECIQGRCANITTGCWGECSLRASFPLNNVACGDAVQPRVSEQADERALFMRAIDSTYPIPNTPHQSVAQRAMDNREAFSKGWDQAWTAHTQQAAPEAPTGDDVRGPLTDAQRQECRHLYNNLKHLESAGYHTADDVIRKAAVYGYMNGRHDFTSPVAAPEAPASEQEAPVKAGDRITDGIFTTLLDKNGATVYNALKAAGRPAQKIVSRAATTASASERARIDSNGAFTFPVNESRATVPSRATGSGAGAAAEVREFVEAIANNYDAYDSADDETGCRGCSALIEDGQAVAHQPGCIVPRAQAWIAAHPGDAPAGGKGGGR